MNRVSEIDIAEVRAALTEELEEIERLDQSSAEGRKTTSLGRLSRMDALQHSA